MEKAFSVFKSASYLGSYSVKELYGKKTVIALGSIISINDKRYCVENVMVKLDGSIILEVS